MNQQMMKGYLKEGFQVEKLLYWPWTWCVMTHAPGREMVFKKFLRLVLLDVHWGLCTEIFI